MQVILPSQIDPMPYRWFIKTCCKEIQFFQCFSNVQPAYEMLSKQDQTQAAGEAGSSFTIRNSRIPNIV
jgi:hypothetical protein